MPRLLCSVCCCTSCEATSSRRRGPAWIPQLLCLLCLILHLPCLLLLRLLLLLHLLLLLLLLRLVRYWVVQQGGSHRGWQGTGGQGCEHGQVQLQAAQPQDWQVGAAAPLQGRPVLMHLSIHLQGDKSGKRERCKRRRRCNRGV